MYINKAEKKGRTKEEVDQVIFWLLGYDGKSLQEHLVKNSSVRVFFDQAPELNEKANLIKGKVCGVQVEEIEDDTMRRVRYLDKLVDELAKGKPMEKILRKQETRNERNIFAS